MQLFLYYISKNLVLRQFDIAILKFQNMIYSEFVVYIIIFYTSVICHIIIYVTALVVSLHTVYILALPRFMLKLIECVGKIYIQKILRKSNCLVSVTNCLEHR